MEGPSYYSTLGLEEGATLDEIKKAYRKLAKKYHPDKSKEKGTAGEFRKINKAYINLTNLKESRADQEEECYTYAKFEEIGITVKEKSQSVVLEVKDEQIDDWCKICSTMYGTPADLGRHGLKFTSHYQDRELAEDHKEIYGSIHVTIYHTGRILIQGNSYMLWVTDHLPLIVSKLRETTKELHKTKRAQDKKHTPIMLDGESSTILDENSISTHEVILRHTPSVDKNQDNYGTNSSKETQTDSQTYTPEIKQHEAHSNSTILKRLNSLEEKIVNVLEQQGNEITILKLKQSEAAIAKLQEENNALQKKNRELNSVNLKMKEELSNKKENTPNAAPCNCPQLQIDLSKAMANILEFEENVSQKNKQIKNLEQEAKQLRKSKHDDEIHNNALANTIMEKDHQIETQETLVSVLQNNIEKLSHENKNLYMQLQSAWESGTNGFETVDRQKPKPRNTATTPTDHQLLLRPNYKDSSPTNAAAHTTKSTDHPVDKESAPKVPVINHPPIHPVHHDSIQEASSSDSHTNNSYNRSEPPTLSNNNTSESQLSEKHLIVTSSLGKDLDKDRLAPYNNINIKIHSISGGCIKDVSDYITNSNQEYNSITILVGSNDLNKSRNPPVCVERYKHMVESVRSKFTNAKLYLCQIPPRLNLHTHNENVNYFNNQIQGLCESYENTKYVPITISNKEKFFRYNDNVHFSFKGTATLAICLRKAILPHHNTNHEMNRTPKYRPNTPSEVIGNHLHKRYPESLTTKEGTNWSSNLESNTAIANFPYSYNHTESRNNQHKGKAGALLKLSEFLQFLALDPSMGS